MTPPVTNKNLVFVGIKHETIRFDLKFVGFEK